MKRGWKGLWFWMGLLIGACISSPSGEPPAVRPTITALGETPASSPISTVGRPTPSPSPSPTPMRLSPLPTATPTPGSGFHPRPLPEGFHTGDHWIAVRVIAEFANAITSYTADRYVIWFTDGQRWVGPVPKIGLYISRLEAAFWRKQGAGWELCARVAVQPTVGAPEAPMTFCTSAPPEVGPKDTPSTPWEALPCPDGRSLCIKQPDGTAQTVPLPEDLFRAETQGPNERVEDHSIRMVVQGRMAWMEYQITTNLGASMLTERIQRVWEPKCVARGRWVVFDFGVHRAPVSGDYAGGGFERSEIYVVDLAAKRTDPLISLQERQQLLKAFQAEGRVPFIQGDERFQLPNHFLAYTSPKGGCSPDGAFLLFDTAADESGLIGFPLSWVARLEDRRIYPLPGDQAQWVVAIEEGP